MKLTKLNIQDVFKSEKMDIETAKLKGYELIEELFCDNSGFGAENEPAYTPNQLINKLNTLLEDNQTYYSFITNIGQFQVYLGIFKKGSKNKNCRKIANNTLEIIENGTRRIRLYATDILTFKDNQIILNSGGYQTHTTKSRINKYLPDGFYIYQKDFNWYVKTINGNIEFKDGMIINS